MRLSVKRSLFVSRLAPQNLIGCGSLARDDLKGSGGSRELPQLAFGVLVVKVCAGNGVGGCLYSLRAFLQCHGPGMTLKAPGGGMDSCVSKADLGMKH